MRPNRENTIVPEVYLLVLLSQVLANVIDSNRRHYSVVQLYCHPPPSCDAARRDIARTGFLDIPCIKYQTRVAEIDQLSAKSHTLSYAADPRMYYPEQTTGCQRPEKTAWE
jgi:hypothetical protein